MANSEGAHGMVARQERLQFYGVDLNGKPFNDEPFEQVSIKGEKFSSLSVKNGTKLVRVSQQILAEKKDDSWTFPIKTLSWTIHPKVYEREQMNRGGP